MGRALLLVLLGIPILVVIHIALFSQPFPRPGEMFRTSSRDGDRPWPTGRWHASYHTVSTHFEVEYTADRGS